jgi:AcrR family transcriptional regulator
MLYAVKPMPRPKSLALTDIAAAALAVSERDGLAGVSMRAVAEELGMGTMSLYRYVSDREHVERLMVDSVLSHVDTELSSRLGWRARLTTLLERAREAAGAHATIVPLLVKHRSASEHSTRWGEAMLHELAEAGFAGTRRVIAFRTLLAYLLGSLQLAYFGSLAGEGTREFAELPLDEYPVLAETARHAQRVDPDSEFRQGLAVILRGLEADL